MPVPRPKQKVDNDTITIAYVNYPEGKGPGSVKDTDGNYWKVWPDKLDDIGFVKDGTYDVEYITEEYRGKTSHCIVAAELAGKQSPLPPARSIVAGDKSEFDRSLNTYVVDLARGNTEFNIAMSNGDIQAGVKVLRTIRATWREYLKPASVKPSPVVVASERLIPDPDYDDEVQF